MILPAPDDNTRPFWEASAQHQFLLPHCSACGRWLHPQLTECGCGEAKKTAWRAASGDATLLAHTEVHYMPVPALRSLAPFTLLLVRTDEGPQLVSSVPGTGHALVAGTRLKASYDDIGSGVSLVRFLPAASE